MTIRAFTFDGATRLDNSTLGSLPDFNNPLSSGIVSYWYRSGTRLTGVVMLAYAKGPPELGHCLRLMHLRYGASTVLNLMLQRAGGTTADPGVSFIGTDDLPTAMRW